MYKSPTFRTPGSVTGRGENSYDEYLRRMQDKQNREMMRSARPEEFYRGLSGFMGATPEQYSSRIDEGIRKGQIEYYGGPPKTAEEALKLAQKTQGEERMSALQSGMGILEREEEEESGIDALQKSIAKKREADFLKNLNKPQSQMLTSSYGRIMG